LVVLQALRPHHILWTQGGAIMSAVRQLAEAINTVAESLKNLGEAIYERITRESKRIDDLEQEIERLKREPRKSFGQKIRERS
jgi:uncharacterized protein Yka (UPF0111/DUF47 family)